jgi:hypothetical protein
MCVLCNVLKQSNVPSSNERAKAKWSLSEAMPTTRANFAVGKYSINVHASAFADASVCADGQMSTPNQPQTEQHLPL